MASGNFEITKKNYERKLWTEAMLRALVVKGKLTEEEFAEITGRNYTLLG